jgi:uncharacterized membrane protein YeaQ/YmgE (transglycosylase-associated protein family)
VAVINILAWIFVGAIAGWVAALSMQGTGLGTRGDVVVGIVGALVGGVIVSLLLPGEFSFGALNIASLVIAFIGAVILLVILRAIRIGDSHTI